MPENIKTIGLFGKYGDATCGEDIARLADWLRGHGYAVRIEQETARLINHKLDPALPFKTIGAAIDIAIVIGGDGTLLNVARHLAAFEVPLVGVNMGRLGFLTDIPVEHMETEIGHILNGEFERDERFMLTAEIMRAGKIIKSFSAMNDVIIGKGELSRIIELEVFESGEFVHSVRGDGLIISTPTGSTAYALSAGGPIVHPGLPAMVLVPICPHTLSNRPIVVSSDAVIETVVTGTSQQRAHVTFDGQEMFALDVNDRVYTRRAEHPVQLIHPAGGSHYDVLRAKLRWGELF